jgi:hypothetical protein
MPHTTYKARSQGCTQTRPLLKDLKAVLNEKVLARPPPSSLRLLFVIAVFAGAFVSKTGVL